MNFKILLIVVFISAGCGVKSKPVSPSEYRIPSIIDQHTTNENKKNNN